ncbi:MAG: DUF11 domain-containing protein, partial [Defluviitaleaceae bacterium]|nr:DUF11 domain-containing protein [Defluviitaleaceae bacterium]
MNMKKYMERMRKYLVLPLIAIMVFGAVPIEPLVSLVQGTEFEFVEEEQYSYKAYLEEQIYEDAPIKPLIATMTPIAIDPMNTQPGVITLTWVANNGQNHLALDPRNNTIQTHIMEMNFSPQTGKTFNTGEIEIRLPYALFRDRDNQLITRPGNRNSPLSQIPLPGPSAFEYTIDTSTNEIVITNYREFNGDNNFNVQFGFNYLPSESPNGYRKNGIYAHVTFAEKHERADLISNHLSLHLTTRVDAYTTTKQAISSYNFWSSEWGPAPANARNYFFVRYRLDYGVYSTTTQPYTVRVQVTPNNGGVISAWTNLRTSIHNDFFWTHHRYDDITVFNNESFNNREARTLNINRPGSSLPGGWHQQEIIVRYQRIGTSRNVSSAVNVVFIPRDNSNITRNVRANYNFRYAPIGDLFSITKAMPTSILGRLSLLEAGSDGSFTGRIEVESRLANSTQPFTTTVIDDRMYLRLLSGIYPQDYLLLEPGDYRFTRVQISNYTEIELNDDVLHTVTGVYRSPIELYYRTSIEGEWILFTTVIPQSFDSFWYFLPNDANVQGIKAVHESGQHQVNFTLNFGATLNSTQRVRDFIRGYETVQFVNFGHLLVNNQKVGSIEAWTNMTRITTSSTISVDSTIRGGIISQPNHSRMRIPHRIRTQTNTEGNRLPDEAFEQIILEQREGVFYTLLHRGTILDTSSIVVRNVHGDIIPYPTLEMIENWQNSGRTLVIIGVSVPEGTNRRNHDNPIITTVNPLHSGGTGFLVDFDVFYPWMNINLFGANLRPLFSYQSRNGPLLGGNAHTNGNNTGGNNTGGWALNSTERDLMSNFPHAINLEERNIVSTARSLNVSPLTSDQTGFTKTVRATGDTTYHMETAVRPGGSYTYRLQYVGPMNDRSRNLVMFDVLEAAHYGRDSFKGIFESIDVSHPQTLGIDPQVYFSTHSGLDPFRNTAHANLNSSYWSRIQPENNADITAIAIDLSTRTNGQPFIFEPRTGTVVNIHMRAPHGNIAKTNAFNRAQYRITTITPIGTITDRPIAQPSYTTVELLGRNLTLDKTSNPLSGTAEEPKEVFEGDTINYEIAVINNEEMAIRNIKIEDVIPEHMSINPLEIKGFFGNNRSMAIPLYTHTRVSYDIDGNTITLTIQSLGVGERFTLLLPTTIDKNLTRTIIFENTTQIIGIDDQEYDIKSDTTYHIFISSRDIRITKTSDPVSGTIENPTRVYKESTVNYTVTVLNNGEESEQNIILEDTIPEHTKFESNELKGFFGSNSSIAMPLSELMEVAYEIFGNRVILTIEELEAGETFTLLIPATINPNLTETTVFENIADIIEVSGEEYNVASNTTYHAFIPRDITITKTSDPMSGTSENPTEIFEESTVNYTIVVHNNEEVVNQNVVIKDVIPEYMSFDSAKLRGFFGNSPTTLLSELPGITYDIEGNAIRITILALNAEETFTLLIPAKLNADTRGVLVFENIAHIIEINGREYAIESNTTHHIARLSRDITVTKISDPVSGTLENPTRIFEESAVNYTITVHNNEEVNLQNIIIEDTLPEYMSVAPNELKGFFGNNPSMAIPLSGLTNVTYSIEGNKITLTIGELDSEEAFTLLIPATLNPELAKTTVFENTARITKVDGEEQDIESDTTYHIFIPRDVTITKISDPVSGTGEYPTEIFAESTVNYTVTISNNEEVTNHNVVIKDIIPEHMSFDPNELKGFFGSNTATPLSELAGITYEVFGNTIKITIVTLPTNETFTLLIPTTLEPDLTGTLMFENTAHIIEIDGRKYNIESNTTHHFATFSRDVTIYKTSDWENGTLENPTRIFEESTINYKVITHNNEEVALSNIVIEDVIPEHMNFDPNDLKGFFGDNLAIPLSEFVGVTYETNGSTLRVTIGAL